MLREPSLRLTADVRFRRVGTEGILIAQDGPTVMVVNEVGVTVLEYVARGASHDEIVAALVDTFEVSAAVASADLATFVESLTAHRVLKAVA